MVGRAALQHSLCVWHPGCPYQWTQRPYGQCLVLPNSEPGQQLYFGLYLPGWCTLSCPACCMEGCSWTSWEYIASDFKRRIFKHYFVMLGVGLMGMHVNEQHSFRIDIYVPVNPVHGIACPLWCPSSKNVCSSQGLQDWAATPRGLRLTVAFPISS